jgi:cytochrome c biogenesis protein CcdA
MYLIISYLSYVTLGLFTVLITTYLIPSLKIFQTKNSNNKKSNQVFLYLGFLLSYILIYYGLDFIKHNQNNTILGFLLLTLFISIIIHSILLISDIKFIDILKGIKIKSFKNLQLAPLLFGMKFSFVQILCNPIFFILIIINIFNLTNNSDSITNISLYVLGLVISIHLISNLSNKQYNWLIRKINYKQKLINLLSETVTIIIILIFILKYII